jgi:ArsR family transcriptional regulator, arsenate/arsenite/antimonite-responsive transcriptional repressor
MMANKTLNDSAKLLKALGSTVRLNIVITFLANEKNCLCEIQPMLKLSQPTLSRHLAVLRNAGILEDKKVNNKIFYKVKDKRVVVILKALGIYAKGEKDA